MYIFGTCTYDCVYDAVADSMLSSIYLTSKEYVILCKRETASMHLHAHTASVTMECRSIA